MKERGRRPSSDSFERVSVSVIAAASQLFYGLLISKVTLEGSSLALQSVLLKPMILVSKNTTFRLCIRNESDIFPAKFGSELVEYDQVTEKECAFSSSFRSFRKDVLCS